MTTTIDSSNGVPQTVEWKDWRAGVCTGRMLVVTWVSGAVVSRHCRSTWAASTCGIKNEEVVELEMEANFASMFAPESMGRSSFLRLLLLWLRRKSGARPKRHPTVTPDDAPTVSAHHASFCSIWWADIGTASGIIFPDQRSIYPRKAVPIRSATALPKPADKRVVRPRVAPMEFWIASPAMIIIALSVNPNPTIPIAALVKSWTICFVDSGFVEWPYFIACASAYVANSFASNIPSKFTSASLKCASECSSDPQL